MPSYLGYQLFGLPRNTSHKKFLTFRGILEFYISSILTSITLEKAQCLYNEAPENCPFFVKGQQTVSSSEIVGPYSGILLILPTPKFPYLQTFF
jgi:hypothetical protein